MVNKPDEGVPEQQGRSGEGSRAKDQNPDELIEEVDPYHSGESAPDSTENPSSLSDGQTHPDSRGDVSTAVQEGSPDAADYGDPYGPVAHSGGGGGYYHPPHSSSEEEYPEEEEGGPVKPFLEHLEDLRWVLIKSVATVILGMVICLVAANKLVGILTWPLDRANLRLEQAAVEREDLRVWMEWGTNLTRFPVGPGGVDMLPGITNGVWTLRMVPTQVGTNWVLGVHAEPTGPEYVSKGKRNLIILGPMEGFKVALQVAIYGGLALASPFLLYFAGQFVLPALRRDEKNYLLKAVTMGTVLFALGVLFCYFVVVQIVLMAAVNFSHWLDFGADQWRASDYIGVVCKFMLGMGAGFELPIVLLTLVKLDLLDYQKLSKFRPYWVVVNLMLSSVLTPPDPVSMLLMALPLQVLYEFSVLVARYWARKEKEKQDFA
jgi:sec-independent protein translocase protein TatC